MRRLYAFLVLSLVTSPALGQSVGGAKRLKVNVVDSNATACESKLRTVDVPVAKSDAGLSTSHLLNPIVHLIRKLKIESRLNLKILNQDLFNESANYLSAPKELEIQVEEKWWVDSSSVKKLEIKIAKRALRALQEYKLPRGTGYGTVCIDIRGAMGEHRKGEVPAALKFKMPAGELLKLKVPPSSPARNQTSLQSKTNHSITPHYWLQGNIMGFAASRVHQARTPRHFISLACPRLLHAGVVGHGNLMSNE